jgi:hypothetical protein
LFPNLPVVLSQREQPALGGEPAQMTGVPPEP